MAQLISAVGSWVFLSQAIATGTSTLSFTGISPNYNNYVLLYNNMTFSTTLSLGVQLNTGSGFIASGYKAGQNAIHYNAATLTNVSLTTSLMFSNAASGNFLNGICYLQNLTSGNGYPSCFSHTMRTSTVTSDYLLGQGFYLSTPTVTTSIQVIADSGGTINTGTFTLYGIDE